MPKAKKKLAKAEQKRRFEAKVKELIDAGELSPTEADATVDRLVRHSVRRGL
jgi:polyhydroxyalkanoate synthesis regulator phasin